MTNPTCTHCHDNYWIGIQHPLKPPGVSIQMVPCEKCNKDGKKEWPHKTYVSIRKTAKENSFSEIENSETIIDVLTGKRINNEWED